MSDCIGEGCLLTHQDALGKVISLKGMSEQIFSLSVHIHFFGRINAHDILYEIQIAERHPGFHGVDGDTSVRTKHIIQIQFPDSLGGFLLEAFGVRSKIRIFISEQLIGDLAGQQYPDIRGLMNGLTDQVHSDACTNCCNIKGSEDGNHLRKRPDDILLRNNDLRMLTSDMVCYLFCIL